MADAHCAIHFFGAVNSAPRVTNSVFERLSYGVMAYTTAPVIENSAFIGNANDVGFCFGATEDNVPALQGNYYESGAPLVDPSCFVIGTTDASPLGSMPSDIGPSDL